MEFFSENLQSEDGENSSQGFNISKLSEEQIRDLAINIWLLFSSSFLSERDKTEKISHVNIGEEQTVAHAKDVIGYIRSLEDFHSDLLKSVHGAVDSGSSLLKEVKELREFIAHISDSVKNINDIAERVHVLSLNAAIEAARAGERGKGFAVVSSEIRNLAGSTAQRVDEISEYIHQSASTVERVVEGIQSTVSTVSTTQQQMDNAREQIKTIENLSVKVRDEIKKGHIFRLVDSLRTDHAALRVMVYQSLLKGEPLGEDVVPNAHNCALGRWYRENKSLHVFSDITVYQQLEVPHEKFHESIDGIRQALNEDNAEAITKYIETLEEANSEISNILLDVTKGIE